MERGHDDDDVRTAAVEKLWLHSPAGPAEAVYQWPFYIGVSVPFLFSAVDRRSIYLAHDFKRSVTRTVFVVFD